MAEYDVKSALQAYDLADLINRKVWELIFGNTYNGMRWAKSRFWCIRSSRNYFVNPIMFVLHWSSSNRDAA